MYIGQGEGAKSMHITCPVSSGEHVPGRAKISVLVITIKNIMPPSIEPIIFAIVGLNFIVSII